MDQISSDDISEISRYVNDTKLKHKTNRGYEAEAELKKCGI